MECHGNASSTRITSGSYFEKSSYAETVMGENGGKIIIGLVGGTAGKCQNLGGSGGTGGTGGNVVVARDLTQIHAYNGAYITDEGATIDQTDTWKQENQSIIYAQVGYSLVDLRVDTEEIEFTYDTDGTTYTTTISKVTSITSRTATDLITELGDSYRSIDYSVYTTYGAMGIGSGGGCIEVSNGTLTVND